jgi:hypothetical protein
MFALINQTRNQAGLAQLTWDERLAQAALDHAKIMASRGSLSHQFPGEPELGERLNSREVRMDLAGENVVYDQTIESAHDNLMESPPHRANILDPKFDSVGVGIVESGKVLYIAEDFSHHMTDATDDVAAEMVAKAFGSMRQSSGGKALHYSEDSRLRQVAEAMARREAPDAAAAMAVRGVRLAAAYATHDPTTLPPAVAALAKEWGINHYSVGVCFARTPKYPSGLYWITIAVFDSAELKSARAR